MYQLRTPHTTLRPFIEHYWFVDGTPSDPLDLRVDVYVDGRPDLVLPIGATYARTVVGGATTHFGQANFDMQRTHAIRIRQQGLGRTTGVRFHLGGLGPFAVTELRGLTNTTPTPAAVLGPGTEAWLEQIGQTADADGQAALLDRFFLARFQDSAAHTTFREALEAVVMAGGKRPVEAIAEAAGVSVRQLERLFARFLGIAPRTTARIVRFQRALRLLMVDPGTSLADVAHATGFFDQAHFVREFRRMTGGGVPRGYRGYYPPAGPKDFAPNVVAFVQDPRPGRV